MRGVKNWKLEWYTFWPKNLCEYRCHLLRTLGDDQFWRTGYQELSATPKCEMSMRYPSGDAEELTDKLVCRWCERLKVGVYIQILPTNGSYSQ